VGHLLTAGGPIFLSPAFRCNNILPVAERPEFRAQQSFFRFIEVTHFAKATKEGGMYVQMLTWKKGNGSLPHFHPNDLFFLVL